MTNSKTSNHQNNDLFKLCVSVKVKIEQPIYYGVL